MRAVKHYVAITPFPLKAAGLTAPEFVLPEQCESSGIYQLAFPFSLKPPRHLA